MNYKRFYERGTNETRGKKDVSNARLILYILKNDLLFR